MGKIVVDMEREISAIEARQQIVLQKLEKLETQDKDFDLRLRPCEQRVLPKK